MDGTALNKKYKLTQRVKALEEGGGGGGYVLPTATDERLGGIKVGAGLSVEEDGTLNANATPYTPPAYSTSEVNTGVKWIDNRDIFRKVIDFGELPKSTSKSVGSGLENVTVIDIRGIAVKAEASIPLPYATTENKNVQLHYAANTNQVIVTTVQDLSSYADSYVVLLYVKNPPTRKKK